MKDFKAGVLVGASILASVLMLGVGLWFVSLRSPKGLSSLLHSALALIAPSAERWAATNSYPKLSPFSAIRWHDTSAEVEVNGVWYEWLGLNDQSAKQIVDAAMKLDRRNWQKRVNEDLVELMAQMGHQPGSTVSLQLRNLDTSDVVTLPNVANTEANRWAIWKQTNQTALGKP